MHDKYCDVQEGILLRKKLLKFGLGNTVIGPTGPTGPKGEDASSGSALVEGMFFTGFASVNDSGQMGFDTPWMVPNDNEFFSIIGNSVEVVSGIYEINMSGFISGIDDSHGVEVYLSNDLGDAIKDLNLNFNMGNSNEIYFSKSILFRFDDRTLLDVMVNIDGDINTSQVVVSEVNLFLKKIHE